MRLVDADSLEKEGWSLHRTVRVDMHTSEHQTKPIAKVPTIDPVRKGKWIKISPAGIYECSVCGLNLMTGDIDVYSWCHGCGAKMEEGD